MFTREIVLTLGISALAFGCAAQPSETQETIDNLVQAGFPADDIMVIDGVVYVGGDAAVSLEASREMLQVDPSNTKEQYRTSNLVGSNVTNICINGAAFTGAFSEGLNRAISSYNALGLQWRMSRTAGSTSGCSAVITANITKATEPSSGFPSRGLPFNAINIPIDTINRDPLIMGYVIAHELGHTVGIRHTDYYNRSISCGTGGSEGDGGVGAILIPGTPRDASPGGSIMNSCPRADENGEFRASDIAALNALY